MIKTGIYVDAENVRLCGGYGMRYDALIKFASISPSFVLRANAYVVEDADRTKQDEEYKRKLYRYHNILRSCGFKVIKKFAQRYIGAEGEVSIKANADMDLAIDAILQSRNLDRVVLLSGDGDYTRLILALQNKGCRVDVVGFQNVASILKATADSYISGFLIPGLLPLEENKEITRGYPVTYWPEKGYGFMRYLIMQEEGVCEQEVFFHHSGMVEDYPPTMLSRHTNIFEFNVVPSTVKEGEFMADKIRLAYRDIVV